MEFFLEPFSLGFQQRALMGGIAAALMTAVVGTWLVLRGMSFFGDAFVHGVIPGIAAAAFFDFNPLIGAAIAALVMVVAIELIHRQTTLSEDTAIGLLFVGMLALGVVIVSKLSSFSGSITSILFGDALGVTTGDLQIQFLLAAVVIVVGVLMYRPLLALALSEDKAQLWGFKPKQTHAIFLALVAVSVIGSYRSVGTLLVFGFLVGPPAAAALISRSVKAMMLIASIIGVLSVWLGLMISYYWSTAGSATMAVIPVLIFFLLLVTRPLWRRPSKAIQVMSHE
jgi:ABC-type Mn2+/Zn2+ transport system permease subunit